MNMKLYSWSATPVKKTRELPVFLNFIKIRKMPGAPKLPDSQVKIIPNLVLHPMANKYFVFLS